MGSVNGKSVKTSKKAKSGVATTYEEVPGKAEKHTTETVIPAISVDSDAPLANVNVSLGARIGMENYSDFRCGVSITMPSLPDEGYLEQTYQWSLDWCDTRLQQIIDKIQEENA